MVQARLLKLHVRLLAALAIADGGVSDSALGTKGCGSQEGLCPAGPGSPAAGAGALGGEGADTDAESLLQLRHAGGAAAPAAGPPPRGLVVPPPGTMPRHHHHVNRLSRRPVVSVPGLGKLRGNRLLSGVREFLGVPYARPPVGQLRFRPPVANVSWPSMLDATRYGPACWQSPTIALPASCPSAPGQDEDCLSLNIWLPPGSANRRLPVYVWIHGGGAKLGCGAEYDGSAIAATQGVVVVTMNYRLGILGLLASEELHHENKKHHGGSYGGQTALLDTLEAVRWVKRHIAAFGGDPDNLTLGGESNGANTVCNYLFSPLAKDLGIKRFSMMSQSCIGPWASSPLKTGLEYGKKCMGSVFACHLSTMRWISAWILQDACTDPYPSVDGYFLPEDIRGGLAPLQVDLRDTKVMLGMTDRDGLSLSPPFGQVTTSMPSISTLWKLQSGRRAHGQRALINLLASGTANIPSLFLNGFPGFGKRVAREIADMYSSQELPGEAAGLKDEPTRMLWAIQRDVVNTCPTLWLADKLLPSASVFLYWFWLPARSAPKSFFGGTPTAHSADLPYLWASGHRFKQCGKTCPMIDVFRDRVGALVRGEEPWDPYDPDASNFLNLTLDAHMRTGFQADVCAWWRRYIERGARERDRYYDFVR